MSNNAHKKETVRLLRALRRWILLLIICLLLAAVACAAAFGFERDLKNCAYNARDDLKAALSCLARQDADGAERMTEYLDEDITAMEELLDSPLGRIAARTSLVKREMDVVRNASSLLKEGSEELLRPYIAFMRAYPLSGLKTPDGEWDLAFAGHYVAYLRENSETLLRFCAELEEFSAMPYGRLESRLGDLRDEMQTLCRAVPLALDAADELAAPALELLQSCPLEGLKTGDGGISVAVIERYLAFADEKMPCVRALIEKLDALGLEELDGGERLTEYFEKARSLLELYDRSLAYQPVLRAFLGGGEDRLYVFAAQNASEIRASGGFPGAVGTIRIRDGVLRLEDFQPVNHILSYYGSGRTGISSTELTIFGDWFLAPRDADFCPDFERVAEIWAVAYEENNGEPVDGVLSATPVIIQRLLSVVGEVELSDGTVLDGTNAVRMLEYEMYYRFFGYGSDTDEGNDLSDALFAETAKRVMEKTTRELGLSNVGALLSVAEESAADRTLMLWMKDEAEQELVRAADLDCGLNRDPAAPEAGVYFSLTNPSRMGWFLNMNPSVELLGTHEDGSKTYAVHLDMSNVMTEEEFRTASWYITGSGNRGIVTGYLYLFAPAGGTIGEIGCSDGTSFFPAQYHDLELRWTHQIFIRAGNALTVDYTVTTAPCEQAELAVSMTPTLQLYR